MRGIRRVWICAVAVISCILCSGCTEHMSAEDIEDIQPMTKREFELAYTETLKSQLYAKYKEYNQGDSVVTYEISRGENSVTGSFFDINGITVVEGDDCYYFKYLDKKYIVETEIGEYSGNESAKPEVFETIVKNISKTYISDISNNVEIHKSSNGVDEILRGNVANDGNRTEITITFLKNYIHTEMYDVTTKKKTVVNINFSVPDATQHSVIERISTFIDSQNQSPGGDEVD